MISKQKDLDIQVNGITKSYISNGWSPQKCFSKLPKIGKSFAVPLSMLSGATDDVSFADVLPQALFLLFEQMEEQDVWELFELIVEDVFVNAQQKVNLNEDLEGDLGAVLGLVAATLQHNYGSLFSGNGLSSLMQNLMGVAQVAQAK